MRQIDARGLSCPEPLILVRRAMDSHEASYEVIVDNLAARENVTRYAQHQGYGVAVAQNGGEFTLTLTKA